MKDYQDDGMPGTAGDELGATLHRVDGVVPEPLSATSVLALAQRRRRRSRQVVGASAGVGAAVAVLALGPTGLNVFGQPQAAPAGSPSTASVTQTVVYDNLTSTETDAPHDTSYLLADPPEGPQPQDKIIGFVCGRHATIETSEVTLPRSGTVYLDISIAPGVPEPDELFIYSTKGDGKTSGDQAEPGLLNFVTGDNAEWVLPANGTAQIRCMDDADTWRSNPVELTVHFTD